MSVIETLTQRNEAFASSRFSADLKIVPSMKTMIIGCVDPRVDPVDMFGLAPGEAAVIRNVGGRSPRQRSRQAMLRIVATARSHQQWFRPAFGPQENSAPPSGQSSRAPARQDVGKVNLPESVPTAAPIAQFGMNQVREQFHAIYDARADLWRQRGDFRPRNADGIRAFAS
jgi:hypothetical protein